VGMNDENTRGHEAKKDNISVKGCTGTFKTSTQQKIISESNTRDC